MATKLFEWFELNLRKILILVKIKGFYWVYFKKSINAWSSVKSKLKNFLRISVFFGLSIILAVVETGSRSFNPQGTKPLFKQTESVI
ncbi:hypothetical protein [Helicobacter pylori]|uniref:hypothetical protein n=1 Tax=Helicobacter pylori TaxID=210 RepID=UPI001E40FE0D|nr:hypothetical protein [Helicobacter pylori]